MMKMVDNYGWQKVGGVELKSWQNPFHLFNQMFTQGKHHLPHKDDERYQYILVQCFDKNMVSVDLLAPVSARSW